MRGVGVVGLGVPLRAVHEVEVLRRRRVDEPRAALALSWIGFGLGWGGWGDYRVVSKHPSTPSLLPFCDASDSMRDPTRTYHGAGSLGPLRRVLVCRLTYMVFRWEPNA